MNLDVGGQGDGESEYSSDLTYNIVRDSNER